ncbi:MAG: thioredoxin domain-containing protein [Ferruginibacter sp.]
MKKIMKILPTVIISFLILSCNAQIKTTLTADEFEKAINTKDSVQVLDVRTAGEYNSGHIANALQADWSDPAEFNRRIGFVDKNKPVYVYCLAGGRSAAAAARMRDMGYEHVYELKGGTNAWKAANKALEGKPVGKQMSVEAFSNAISGSKTVLVDFGAEWCPPCRKMEPVLTSLQNNNPGKFSLVKVDAGNDQNLVQKYHVTALPVFIIFRDGKEVWRKDGFATEKEIAEHL